MIHLREIMQIDTASLRNPIAFVGMPGVASVGRLAALGIARSLDCKRAMEVFCIDSPPSVEVRKNGHPRLPHGVIYFSDRSDSPRDVFVFTGDFQPSNNVGQYEYADYIARTCKAYNVDTIISLAASVLGYIPTERKVWVAGTSAKLIEKFSQNKKTKVFRGATISGVNGLAPVIASLVYKIDGACLLADTYPLLKEDPAASKCLLEVVGDRLEIPIELTILDKRIERVKRELGRIEEELSKRPAKPSKQSKSPEYFG